MGGRNIDDSPPGSFLHVRDTGFSAEKSSGQHDGNQLIPFFQRKVFYLADKLQAGIIDNNISRTKSGYGLFYHGINTAFVGDIATCSNCFTTFFDDFFSSAPGSSFIKIGGYYLSLIGCQM